MRKVHLHLELHSLYLEKFELGDILYMQARNAYTRYRSIQYVGLVIYILYLLQYHHNTTVLLSNVDSVGSLCSNCLY